MHLTASVWWAWSVWVLCAHCPGVSVHCPEGDDQYSLGIIRHLLTITEKQNSSFREVFPKNYRISHHYSTALLCTPDTCCVLRAAAVLSRSWTSLLSLLYRENLVYRFIEQTVETLHSLTQRVQEPEDLSFLPSLSSTPEELLFFTSSLLVHWLELDCVDAASGCIFPTATTGEEEEQLEKEGEGEGRGEREGERGEREGERREREGGCGNNSQMLLPISVHCVTLYFLALSLSLSLSLSLIH
ncbi:uncharacterized protein LOC136758366 [Amia ocellicauda]|uniref:uncharacterized protein LOC136758366 n=1 Tax=Amia ocellicauda TaxID=2972642 RepID=UPI003464DBFF